VWGTFDAPDKKAQDLIALREHPSEDPFSEFFIGPFMSWLDKHIGWRIWKPAETKGPRARKHSTLLRITGLMTTSIACLLPVLAILVLSCVKSTGSRLGVIATFNVVFTFCLSLFTTAKRAEIFAITAAFAAIQVVFVTSNCPPVSLS